MSPSPLLRALLIGVMLTLPIAAFSQSDPSVAAGDGVGSDDAEDASRVEPPELLEEAAAPFPEAALDAEVEADVVVEIDVEIDGSVSNVTPLQLVYYTYDDEGYVVEDAREVGDDPWGFVPNALRAVEQYVFAPARLYDADNPEGIDIPVRVTWRVGFVVDYEEVEVPLTSGSSGEDVEGSGEGERSADAGVVIDPEGPVTLEGQLLRRGYREPLAALVVEATLWNSDPPVSASAISDTDGRFAFPGLPAGRWVLVVEAAGFKRLEFREDVVEGSVTEITLYVERDDRDLLISRTVEEAPAREVTRRRLQVTEIQRIPGNNNDAIRVVQNLPGVARSQFNGGDVIIRGSEPEDTGFYLNGMRIPAVYHFGGLRAVFPTELLDEINFYPGGFSTEFGRSTSGIIDVTTNDELPERVTGHVDTNVFDTGVWLRVPVSERVSLDFGGRRSYIDAILRPLGPALGLNFTQAPRYWDYQARVLAELGDNHRLSVLGYGSDDRIELVLDDEEDLDPEFRGGFAAALYFHGIQARLQSDLSDTVQNDASLQYVRQSLFASFGEELRFDLKTHELRARNTITWRPSSVFALRYGIDIESNPGGNIFVNLPRPPKEGEEPLDFEATEIITTDEQFRIFLPGQFVEAELEPVEGFRIIPGLRLDYYTPPERWSYDARLAMRYAFNETWLVKGAIGTFHIAPTPEETSDGFGNPDLDLERAVHYVLGTEVNLTEYVNVNLELFYKDLSDLVSRSDELVERNGEEVPEVYNNGAEGRVYGAELLLRHEFNGRFFGWIAYTLSRSERLDFGETRWRVFDFDQTHILTALGSYQLPRNWSIGARWRYVTGNPTTPIVDSVYDSDNDVYTRVPGRTNSARTSPFHQLDVRVDKRWIRDRYTLNLYLDLQNAYNRMNEEDVQYNYDYTESQAVTGLPLIPGFGFRAEF